MSRREAAYRVFHPQTLLFGPRAGICEEPEDELCLPELTLRERTGEELRQQRRKRAQREENLKCKVKFLVLQKHLRAIS